MIMCMPQTNATTNLFGKHIALAHNYRAQHLTFVLLTHIPENPCDGTANYSKLRPGGFTDLRLRVPLALMIRKASNPLVDLFGFLFFPGTLISS